MASMQWEDVIMNHNPADALPQTFWSVYVDGKFRKEFAHKNNAGYFAQRLMQFDPRIARIVIRETT